MSNPKPLVFLADDDGDDLYIFATALDDVGEGKFTLKTFENPKALLDEMDEEMPDVIILDYHFPLYNGLELTLAIRGKTTSKQPKILIWSASASEQEAATCLEAGADWFMTKASGYGRIKEQAKLLVDQWVS